MFSNLNLPLTSLEVPFKGEVLSRIIFAPGKVDLFTLSVIVPRIVPVGGLNAVAINTFTIIKLKINTILFII